jgi:hypothetical protein
MLRQNITGQVEAEQRKQKLVEQTKEAQRLESLGGARAELRATSTTSWSPFSAIPIWRRTSCHRPPRYGH